MSSRQWGRYHSEICVSSITSASLWEDLLTPLRIQNILPYDDSIYNICTYIFIQYLLTGIPILHTFIIAIKEFSIEQLDRDDSEDEMKEEIDNENVEHIFQRVDDTVKHGFQFGNSLDGLQRS